ncbi:kinase-like domain-containing protein [Cantharellus anzutake]|uniref:kinase-like domain-containing protein n=1 Tax=Cantharellus anzutake TaxID=1750568 RepID=UPI0019073C61|nr:kinase-like domain-containing protein [Cantharellus anzutake]KAF8330437.1 kinase-like domain-containing protein [Cantharellus anzutake]
MNQPEVLFIYLNETLTIGRQACDHTIDSPSVSREHCKIYAVKSGTEVDGVILCCQVLGLNGILWNSFEIKSGSTIILLHGDTLRIKTGESCRHFTCYLLRTPPTIHDAQHHLEDSCTKVERLNHFVVQDYVLGDGAHASVRLAFDTEARRQVACKSIHRRNGVWKKSVDDMMKEVHVLQKLRHPNINSILHHVLTSTTLHLFIELCTGGDLFAWLAARQTFSEHEARYMAYQLMLGLMYLHNGGLAHRDFKPENVLLHAPGRFPRLLIADFGYSQNSSPEETPDSEGVAGTLAYLPPEAVKAIYDSRWIDYTLVDCWSFGVVLHEIIADRRPFDQIPSTTSGQATSRLTSYAIAMSQSRSTCRTRESLGIDKALAKRIVQQPIELGEGRWPELPDVRKLVLGLLCRNPMKRLTIERALNSPWISSPDNLGSLKHRYAKHILEPFNATTES